MPPATPSPSAPASAPLRYSATARLLHWVIALMVIATMPIGRTMVQPGIDRSLQDTLFILHKNGGVIILVLMVLRLGWRLLNPPPPMPASVPALQDRIATLAHWGLYALVFVMALSGYVRVRADGFPVEMLDAWGVPALVPRSEALANAAQAVHYWAGYALLALVAAHLLAAAYHGIVRRDGVFSRIWPPVGR